MIQFFIFFFSSFRIHHASFYSISFSKLTFLLLLIWFSTVLFDTTISLSIYWLTALYNFFPCVSSVLDSYKKRKEDEKKILLSLCEKGYSGLCCAAFFYCIYVHFFIKDCRIFLKIYLHVNSRFKFMCLIKASLSTKIWDVVESLLFTLFLVS